jgi:uncharacterized protein YdbL (DUF1318 family)
MSTPSRSFEVFAFKVAGRAFAAALFMLLALGLAPPAEAQSQRLLDAPRAAGQVGERFDGYAVVRGAGPADVARLVDQVNAERRAVYAQRAEADKAPIEAVGKIYAQQIMQSAPSGTWLQGENGQWTQKP